MIPHTCNPAYPCRLCRRATPAVPCGKPDCGCGCSDKSNGAEYNYEPPQPPPPISGGNVGLIVVPAPPPLDLTPRSRTAVVTVAAGETGRKLLAITRTPAERFARRVGADFVALDWPGHPEWPISAKFAVPTALDHYDRVLYADADVLFRPGCVNPFDLCAPDEFGACDEMPWHLMPDKLRHGVLRSYDQLRRETGLSAGINPPWYLNTGVYVCSRQHVPLLAAPDSPTRPYHCGEQDLINARILAGNVKVRLLDRRANWQLWTDHEFRHAPADAVLHWSGSGHSPPQRLATLRAAAGG